MNYYNDHDPKAAAWLRELICAGEIPLGDVDERSIVDVEAADLEEYTQCHFFAGIGGWAQALKLAEWPEDRPVWTGSCPCQPFSTAGRQAGFDDSRHLWPVWFGLIQECHPPVFFGEQIASALKWLDLVSGDVENEGYAIGATIIGAHSVGAPHIRQRLYFVADTDSSRLGQGRAGEASSGRDAARVEPSGFRNDSKLGDTDYTRSQRRGECGHGADQLPAGATGVVDWSACDWLPCTDRKYRPVEPGTFPLAHGVPARVGRLRGYGNAIVPQVAAAFVGSYMELI